VSKKFSIGFGAILLGAASLLLHTSAYAVYGTKPPSGTFQAACNQTWSTNDPAPVVIGTDDDYPSFAIFYVDGNKIDAVWLSNNESADNKTRHFTPNNWNVESLGMGPHKLTAEILDRDGNKVLAASACNTDYLPFSVVATQDSGSPQATTTENNGTAASSVCHEKLATINKLLARITERTENRIERISSILQKVETYYEQSGKKVADYDLLVAKAEKAQDDTETSLLLLQEKGDIDCDGDFKAQIKDFREHLDKTREAARTYKQTVKDIITAAERV